MKKRTKDFGQEYQDLVFRSLRSHPFVESITQTEKWSREDRRGIDFKIKFLGDPEVYSVDFTVATQERILQQKRKMVKYANHQLLLQGSVRDCELALSQGTLLGEQAMGEIEKQISDVLGPTWFLRVTEILAQKE